MLIFLNSFIAMLVISRGKPIYFDIKLSSKTTFDTEALYLLISNAVFEYLTINVFEIPLSSAQNKFISSLHAVNYNIKPRET